MRSRVPGAALLVALLLLPSWAPLASAQAPAAPGPAAAPGAPAVPVPQGPLDRLLQDLQGLPHQAGELGQQLAPPGSGAVPGVGPGPIQRQANTTAGDLGEAGERAAESPLQVIFYEGFEGAPTLGQLGWSQEVLGPGEPPWGIVDALTKKVVRGDGAVFTPEFEKGEVGVPVRDGTHAATLLNPKGRYDARIDARLVSPVIDLRYVRGASASTDDAYRFVTADENAGAPYQAGLEAWRDLLGRQGTGTGTTFDTSFGWLLTTPPSRLERLYLSACTSVNEDACRGLGDSFVNPLADRYGAGLVNLTFYHRYDLSPQFSLDMPAFLDGAFVEVRRVGADGVPGPWEPMLGDPLFEPTVDSNSALFFGFLPASANPVTPSALAEVASGALYDDPSYGFFQSGYPHRVQLRHPDACAGSNVNCKPDTPAWVGQPFSLNQVKSHFTLNAWAGERIQVAFRMHSGSPEVTADEVGWFIDAVKVEGIVPARELGVHEVIRPRRGDQVPTTADLRPGVVVRNYGYLPVEDVVVNFTIEQRLPALTPTGLAAAAGQDANATSDAAAGLAAGQVPGAPQALAGQAQGQAAAPKVLLQASVPLGTVGGMASATATSPVACTACVPGAYVLKVQVASQPLSGGEPGTLPHDRAEDGTPSNNNVSVPFDVRDAAAATVRLSIPAEALSTDIHEPKNVQVTVVNTGNRDLVGDVLLVAQRLNASTLQPLGEAPVPAGSVTIGAGDLPAGTTLTSFGADDATLTATVRWETLGLGPGVYRLSATFPSTPALAAPATDQVLAFIRASPPPYFALQTFDALPAAQDGFSGDRLPLAGFTSAGWTKTTTQPLGRTPLGAVSTNRTWNATGFDGPLLEATALALLGMDATVAAQAGAPSVHPAVATASASARVRFTPTGVEVCRTVFVANQLSENCPAAFFSYQVLEDTLAPPGETGDLAYRRHSYLSDYYLTRNVDLTGCAPPACVPILSFWHTGNFNWLGSADSVGLPGALGGPVAVPGAVHTVSPDQVDENRSRGLVEVTLLDVPAASVRKDLAQAALTRTLADRGVQAPCAVDLTAAACALLQGVCAPIAAAGQPPPLGAPYSAGPLYTSVPARKELCAGAVARDPLASSEVALDFRQPVPAWRQEVLDLSPWAGHQVALGFHFQTPVGRLQERGEAPGTKGPFCKTGNVVTTGPSQDLPRCFGVPLDHWSLDNIRLVKVLGNATETVFLDTVGDPAPAPPQPSPTEWTNWTRMVALRDAADANTPLPPTCYRSLNATYQASGGGVSGADSGFLAPCIQGAQFRAPFLVSDGRGWTPFAHQVGGEPNGFPNPAYDGWFLDGANGLVRQGASDPTRRTALRWGGPGPDGQYPPENLYAIASGPLVSLARAARPFAEFFTNYTFNADGPVGAPAGTYADGGTAFLARYVPLDPSACPGSACRYIPAGRALAVPAGGYPGMATAATFLGDIGANWTLLDPATGLAANNAFTSLNPRAPEWLQVRLDLTDALGRMCLKRVSDADATRIQVYGPEVCAALGTDANITWNGPQGFNATAGQSFVNITTFDADPDALYALEFHALNTGNDPAPLVNRDEAFGWAIDDLRITEEALANDLTVSRVVNPREGALVGPGEELQVRVNVTNAGIFTQRGPLLHMNVTRQGAQVFPDPATGLTAVTQALPLSQPIPGLRDGDQDRNVSVAFQTAWTPQQEGTYVLNVRVELVGEVVGGSLVPLQDENPLNDLFTQVVEVRQLHNLRLLGPAEFPDADAVSPLVGTAEDTRALRVMVENAGTMVEGASAGPDRAVSVVLDIVNEAGQVVTQREAAISRVAPGQRVAADFGGWQPPAGGLFELRFEVRSGLDLFPADDHRAVRMVVLSRVVPAPGQPWQALAVPDGRGWEPLGPNASLGWRFGGADRYAPSTEGMLRLCLPAPTGCGPVDLTSFRGAVLVVEHDFDFEQGYDGGVLEASADGVAWSLLEPVGGYPGTLSAASPEVRVAGAREACGLALEAAGACAAFTGSSGGVVTSLFPLASAAAAQTPASPVLRDTFEGALAAGAAGASLAGAWREVPTETVVPEGKAWWVNKSLPSRPGLLGANPASPGTTLEGRKELRSATFVVPAGATGLTLEFDEWRALGLVPRQGFPLPTGFKVPTSVEVQLERLDGAGNVVASVPLLPRGGTPANPYGDNYLDWTHRSIPLPTAQLDVLKGGPARFVFRMHLAAANSPAQAAPFASPVNGGAPGGIGAGGMDDTDLLSPHLGWAIAAPGAYILATQDQGCKRFEGGRCYLFEDLLGYPDGDHPGARGNWSAAWSLEQYQAAGKVNATDSAKAGGDAMADGGWRLVDRVGALAPKPVWDARAAAPAGSGRGLVAEAQGHGAGARLVTPVNLRGAAGGATLTFDHSFKFTDLQLSTAQGNFRGAVSGGRVEVSRDGGRTWEPLAPVVPEASRASDLVYNTALNAMGMRRMFAQPLFECAKAGQLACIDPSDPFAAPGGWAADGRDHPWTPFLHQSAHTPLAGLDRDPERNSPFGVGSLAYSGTLCKTGSSSSTDCEGPEDWSTQTYDLGAYAGEEILLGFHAWFTSHRFAGEGRPGAVPAVPRDFWRIDNVTVATRLLDGQPLHLRFRATTDATGERSGWDIANVSLLGERHARNVGVRILGPAAGAPLGSETVARALLLNKGQQSLGARGVLLVEQAGAPALANGGFEAYDGAVAQNWSLLPGDGLNLGAGKVRTKHVENPHFLDDDDLDSSADLTAVPDNHQLHEVAVWDLGAPRTVRSVAWHAVAMPAGQFAKLQGSSGTDPSTGWSDVTSEFGVSLKGTAAAASPLSFRYYRLLWKGGDPSAQPRLAEFRLGEASIVAAGAQQALVSTAAANVTALGSADPFVLSQTLDVPPGHWRVVGLAAVQNANLSTNAGAGITVVGALADDGTTDPTVNFTQRPPGTYEPRPFGLNFTVLDEPARVRVTIHADRARLGLTTDFNGSVTVDGVEVLPRPGPGLQPPMPPFDGGFEDGLGRDPLDPTRTNWTLLAGRARPLANLSVPTPGGIVWAGPFEGTRALGLEGTGFGPVDLDARRALDLAPGKYRLTGLLATRGVNWTLVNETEALAAPAEFQSVGAGGSLAQTVAADDLPRRIQGVRLYPAAGTVCTSLTVRLFDQNEVQRFSRAAALHDGACLVEGASGAVDVVVSTTPAKERAVAPASWRLEVTSGSAFGLQALPGAPGAGGGYGGGTLRVRASAAASWVDAPYDLRADFLGPSDMGTTQGRVAVGNGTTFPATTAITLPSTAEYPLRQVVDLEGLPARRITQAAIRVITPPTLPTQAWQTQPDGSVVKGNYTLREGQVRGQLFDLSGRPLSEEAAFNVSRLEPFSTAAGVPFGEDAITVQLNFTSAFLPANTTGVQVGLRGVNFTSAPLKVMVTPDAKLPTPENPLGPCAGGYLAWRGVPNQTGTEPRACGEQDLAGTLDVAMDLAYRVEGRLVLDVPGAVAEPLVLVHPTQTPSSLTATHRGGVPFRIDFVVPAAGTASLRVRGLQWQGEVVLDAFRLEPLTPAGATDGAVLAPGASRLLEAKAPATRGAAYVVTALAEALDAAGSPAGEAFLGDNRAAVATGAAAGPGRIVVEKVEAAPNSVNLTRGEKVELRVRMRNTGAEAAELLHASASLGNGAVKLFEGTQSHFDPLPTSLRFEPFEAREFRWVLTPGPTTPAGVYRLEVLARTKPAGDLHPAPSSGSGPVYVGTSFHAQFALPTPFGNSTIHDRPTELILGAENVARNLWTSDSKHEKDTPVFCPQPNPNANLNRCAPRDPVTLTENLQWMFRKTDKLNNSASRSITLGADSEFRPSWPQTPGEGQVPPQDLFGTLFTALRSPAINITSMERPALIYAERYVMGDGNVLARLLNNSAGRSFPTTAGSTDCPSNASPGWFPLAMEAAGETAGVRTANKWVTRVVDMGPLMDAAINASLPESGGDRAKATTIALARWPEVQVCWRHDQLSPSQGGALLGEWSLDDVVVTPYRLAMGPSQRAPIGDNVTKLFPILLRNDGVFTDTYRVRFDDENGQPTTVPPNWAITLLDAGGAPVSEVRVQPGETRELRVRVEVATAGPTLAREGTVSIPVSVASQTVDVLRATRRITLDFAYPDRPNLRVEGLLVPDAALAVDKPRTVDVLVQNSGGIEAKGVELAVVDRMDLSFGVAPEELRRLDGTPIPAFDIAPGDVKVFTVNWVPRVAGEHNLTAIVDPFDRILEFDERDNILVKPIEVPRAEFPDLAVEASATPSNPSPGDVVDVAVRIRNHGGAPALGVQLSVLAGVTDLLPGDPPHLLPKAIQPGESVTVNASWRPTFPGEQTIIVRARTSAGILERLDTNADNVALLGVQVRSKGLEVAPPPPLTAAPGETVRALVTLRNRGDVDDAYRVRLEPPGDWRALLLDAGEDGKVAVGNRSNVTLTVEVQPPRHAEAGPHALRILARSENSTEAVESSLVVNVPQGFGLRLAVEGDLLLQPGARPLPLRLENLGNGADTVTLRATGLPQGWAVEPATVGVGARATAAPRLNLTIPASAAQGAYGLTVEAQGKDGVLHRQRAAVLVLALESLQLALEDMPAVLLPGQAAEGTLVARNLGNVPLSATLDVGAPQGWRVRLDRDVVSMQPGEVRRIPLAVVLPANATPAAQGLAVAALSGEGKAYQQALPVRVARADLAVLEAELLPRGQIRDGQVAQVQVKVANRGDSAAPAALAVYVDNRLVAFQAPLTLEPGAEARLNASFRAQRGEHVVLVVVDPGKALGEQDEGNNARLLVLRADSPAGLFATPGPEPWMLALGLALALALRRRQVVAR